jgi:hypothetical protein
METRRGSIASPRDQAVTMEIYANVSSVARLTRCGDLETADGTGNKWARAWACV